MNFFRAKVRLWPLIVVPGVLVGASAAAVMSGVVNPSLFAGAFGGVRTNTSEVIKYQLPQQEVALTSLRIEGLERANADGKLFGVSVDAGDRTKYIEYGFNAKLGVDGSQVEIVADGESAYTVAIPSFIFIGHSDEHFEDPIEENGMLSWLTPQISETGMVNNILSTERKDKWVASSLQLLKDQSEVFYGTIIKSVDPDAEITFKFAQSSLPAPQEETTR
ncbi:hypothetical protein ACH0CG_09215 [Microbacterium sp. 179-I 1D1 NHS]|uniref:hypothetical protein n=1 Tax=Microbacterium sp. 179-I 1D1 NHS TaxID=3374298 RepID=UPI0038795A87